MEFFACKNIIQKHKIQFFYLSQAFRYCNVAGFFSIDMEIYSVKCYIISVKQKIRNSDHIIARLKAFSEKQDFLPDTFILNISLRISYIFTAAFFRMAMEIFIM